jgi:hypothetical protein
MTLWFCVLYLHGNYNVHNKQSEASVHRGDTLHAQLQHIKTILETQPRLEQKPNF